MLFRSAAIDATVEYVKNRKVFGTTVASASLVVAVFMLGLGVGAFVAGAWSDRRHTTGVRHLHDYAVLEFTIAVLATGVTLLVPHLDGAATALSRYAQGPDGWFALSFWSHLARVGISVLVVGPVTIAMGATLTVLVRHLVHEAPATSPALSLLYAVNTVGAAAGAFLTDYTLVPHLGLQATTFVAVCLNIAAGTGAWIMGREGQEGREGREGWRGAGGRSAALSALPATGRRVAPREWPCV